MSYERFVTRVVRELSSIEDALDEIRTLLDEYDETVAIETDEETV